MQRDASVQMLALGLGLLLLVAAPQPTQAVRKPNIDPVLCGGTPSTAYDPRQRLALLAGLTCTCIWPLFVQTPTCLG